MNGIYVVTRLSVNPDVFVAENDEQAIKEAERCGPMELFHLGSTELPVGHLFKSHDFKARGRLVYSFRGWKE